MSTIDREQRTSMPLKFFQWQLEERTSLFDSLLRGEMPRFWAAHLPVVSTVRGPDAGFPIHSSTKGVGLIPKPEFMEESVAALDACLVRCAGRAPRETLPDRVATARAFYDDEDRIDTASFGSIEIFRGQTYRNILEDPRATLLFTSPGPNYISYQFNCSTRVVDREDPVFRFILGMRFLFEMERFHIQQPDYPLGYVFTVVETYDKSPKIGTAGKRL